MSFGRSAYVFTPTSISNCTLWLDGADPDGTGVVPSAGNLATWVDKSSSANNAIAGTAVYPQYNTAFLNNLGVVGLTNAADYFTVANNLNSASLTYVFVMKPTTANTGSKCGFLSTDTPGLYGRSIALNNMVLEIEYYNGFALTSITTNSSTWYIISVVFNGTSSITLSYNGIISTYAGSGTGTNSSGLTIGSYNNTSSYTTYNANFYLAEAIVYTSALLQTQYQQVEGYLAQKWGLTSSLPAGHPGLTTKIYNAQYRKPNVMGTLPYYATFSPKSISGCSLWLDAADSSTTTSITSGVWVDKSGGGFNTSYVAGGSGLSMGTINRIPAVTFPGGDNKALNSSAATSTANGFSIFFVASRSNSSPTGNRFITNTSSSLQIYGIAPDIISTYVNNLFSSTSLTIVSGVPFIFSLVVSPSTFSQWVNGTVNSSTGTTGFAAGSTIVIGASGTSYSSSFVFAGQMGEILVFNSAITTTQQQQVESYLAQKWGLTASLPGSHSHATQQAGALTKVSNTIARMVGTPRAALEIPQTIAGLAMWLDATKITGFANGATLTSWTDTIGNRSFSNVNGVTYQTSIMNGLPAVYMNGPGPYLEHSGTPPALVSGGTIYGVVQNNADGLVQPNYSGVTFQVLWQMNGFANGWEGYPYNFNNTTVLGSLGTTRRTWGYPFSSTYFKSPHIVKVVSTTNSWIQSFIQTATSTNASFTDTSASTPTLSAPMRLGASMDGPGLGYYKGYFAEVLLYNRGLNATEQTTIENYLKAKWNV